MRLQSIRNQTPPQIQQVNFSSNGCASCPLFHLKIDHCKEGKWNTIFVPLLPELHLRAGKVLISANYTENIVLGLYLT